MDSISQQPGNGNSVLKPRAAILVCYFVGRRPNACLAHFYGATAGIVDALFAEEPSAPELAEIAALLSGRHAIPLWFTNPVAHRLTLEKPCWPGKTNRGGHREASR